LVQQVFTGLLLLTFLPLAFLSEQAQNFQIWRNGKQVPLFTSVATGTLGATGYIEFWGEKNDGVG
jgi:hypothetical protein